ncbi:MAG: S41 family peptidase [Bacteroidota bacterium]
MNIITTNFISKDSPLAPVPFLREVRGISKKLFFFLFLFTALGNFKINAQPLMGSGQKLDAVFQMLNYAYVDTINEKKLTEDAIRAVLKDLDPHSVYIPAEDLKDANEALVGNFEGVGIQFNILEDTIFVTNTIPGGPSEKVGILAGDRIVKIDTSVVAGIKIKNSDVLKKLRGNKGTKVNVGIARRGEPKLIDFTITRDKIPLFSVDAAYMAAPGIGYIKINKFADTTVDEFKDALKKLKDQGIKSLVLDLTQNGGGYLNRAIELADEFLSDKKRIVYTKGVHAPLQESYSTAAGGWEKGKLVVMIDEFSASASEIVTGAVQDWDRGLVVGRRSFGKGLVQKPLPLPDNSVIRLTVARYYTPSGRCIQKSYQKGEEAYEDDYGDRVKNGELFNADSIHFNDSLKYFTNNKRTVFGGGGIMPDVFVPADTMPISTLSRELQRKGVTNDFSLSYVDRNRSKLLATYPDIDSFKKNFAADEKFLNEFFAFAEKKEVKKDEAGWNRSSVLIETILKSIIARDLYGTGAFYQIYNDVMNDSYKKAIESIQNNTFDKMKIAEK